MLSFVLASTSFSFTESLESEDSITLSYSFEEKTVKMKTIVTDGTVYIDQRELFNLLGYEYLYKADGVLISEMESSYEESVEFRDGFYSGDVVNDLPGGQGVYTSANGVKYEGEWESGQYNGNGTLVTEGVGIYVGEFKNGLKSGDGTMYCYNGDKYTGHWMDGFKNGNGTMWYSDGHRYVGNWKNGFYDGYGKNMRIE